MKQVIQNIRSGELSVSNVPAPCVQPGHLLIANETSLVSAGTEKMIMDLAKKSLLGKARERPDHAKRVLEKIRSEGLFKTIDSVRKKLDEPMTMGYSSAGRVLACGPGVQHFKPGDRVASNGPHAEVVCVPMNLCAKIPDEVEMDHACFAVLGSIALQGLRLTKCSIGESVFVIGLGLVGQLTVALAKAAGMRVIGTDPDQSKCDLAIQMGAEIARPNISASEVTAMTYDMGADAVVIAASTKSNGPIDLSAASVRRKGRVVLVGVVGLSLDRRPFYFKEAEFVVSCSYGPGRYDPDYEQRGHDYPADYVRWTEQRNIHSVLQQMRNGLNIKPLISHEFEIAEASDAYALIESGSEPFLGVVLRYPSASDRDHDQTIRLRPSIPAGGGVRYGMLGAGNFARMVMLPAIAQCSVFEPVAICSAKGVSGTQIGEKSGFSISTTDEDVIFEDPTISTVFSITRHDQHCDHVLKAVAAKKNIFVEKPLCITLDELNRIETAIAKSDAPPLIMVGFNRRYSPAARQVREFFGNVIVPLAISIRFNAGDIPKDHWTQHDAEGGGRIIGEACHAIDLATFLAGSPPVRVFAESTLDPNPGAVSDDQVFITLRHANGSISNIGYLSGGDKAFPKERIEVIGGGQVAVIDDFKVLTTCKNGKTVTSKSQQEKGHDAEIQAFSNALSTGVVPVEWDEILQVSRASILAVQSLREGFAFDVKN